MYFSFRIHVQTQTHTSVDLSFLCMRYGHLYGNAQWPFSSLAFSSLSHLCTVETKQRASTEGAQIRLFKWIGHYTGDAWGYRQKNTITWYLPAFLLSNHSFHLCSTLSAGIHFLPPQSWQITGWGGGAGVILPQNHFHGNHFGYSFQTTGQTPPVSENLTLWTKIHEQGK